MNQSYTPRVFNVIRPGLLPSGILVILNQLGIFATHGELAQLARALAWHARGHRFDSGILHKNSPYGGFLHLWNAIKSGGG